MNSTRALEVKTQAVSPGLGSGGFTSDFVSSDLGAGIGSALASAGLAGFSSAAGAGARARAKTAPARSRGIKGFKARPPSHRFGKRAAYPGRATDTAAGG